MFSSSVPGILISKACIKDGRSVRVVEDGPSVPVQLGCGGFMLTQLKGP